MMGWCAILLDQRTRHALESENACYGLRTDSMLIETDGSLSPQSPARYVTTEIILRLVTEKVEISNSCSLSFFEINENLIKASEKEFKRLWYKWPWLFRGN